MKRWIKFVLIGIAVTGLILSIGYFYAFRKPATAEDSEPVKVYAATELIALFQQNTDSLHNACMMKNIGVNGTLKSINKPLFSLTIDGDNEAEIICTFDSIPFTKLPDTLKPGNTISVKGIYYGHEGFNAAPADPNDLLAAIQTKTIRLRTCAINKP
ncbi:MAG: hypothetical protein ACKO5C_00450 [Ferruginibacter sp.]